MTNPATLTRLEKVAADNGFDLPAPLDGDWLHFSSTQVRLELWLMAFGDNLYLAAFSQKNVCTALDDIGSPMVSPKPKGAASVRSVTSIPALHHLVRRAFALSRTLPTALLDTYQTRTAALPRSTEVERLVVQRVGQNIFRDGLLDYWDHRCAVTGLSVVDLLRASHIKPWADCESDEERLDVFNGLLLAPHLDAAFDRGFITFGADGVMVIANELCREDKEILGLQPQMRLEQIAAEHRPYLEWHRERVFRG